MFGRKKKVVDETVEDLDEIVEIDEIDEVDETDETDELDEIDEIIEEEETPEVDEWVQFDLSKDWREDGPFDIDEVDLSADEVKRIDLGAMILTPEKGMTITLVVSPDKEILHAVVNHGPKSAVHLTVFAAPSAGDFSATIREEIIAHTENAKVIEKAKGPFGTELRRVVTVTDDKGREGFTPMRDWLIEGPRWVLDARLMGQAALEEGGADAVVLEEFVRNIIVRRGEVAMVPGSVVPLKPQEEK